MSPAGYEAGGGGGDASTHTAADRISVVGKSLNALRVTISYIPTGTRYMLHAYLLSRIVIVWAAILNFATCQVIGSSIFDGLSEDHEFHFVLKKPPTPIVHASSFENNDIRNGKLFGIGHAST